MSAKSARYSPYPAAHQRHDPHSPFPSTGTNSVPLATPEDAAARRTAQIQQHQPRGVPRNRGRARVLDVGGYKIPAPPPPAIEGRPSEENTEYAEELRLMLLEDEEDVDSIPADIADSVLPLGMPAPSAASGPDGVSNVLLSEAFRNEYHLPHRGTTTWSRALQTSRSPTPSVVPAVSTTSMTNTLILPGIDATRHRNRFGRGLMAGQETGVGVIGSDQEAKPEMTIANGQVFLTKITNGQHGCDTPAVDVDKAIETIEQGKLNADLPPLAIDHPARMWNSLIHNLEPEKQPIVKWTYSPAAVTGREIGWIATMTMALPLSHPLIKDHSLARAPPANKYGKEYLAAVSLAGGVRTWTGQPRRLKADATNNTLVKCIADGGLTWIQSFIPQRAPGNDADEPITEQDDDGAATTSGLDKEASSAQSDDDVSTPAQTVNPEEAIDHNLSSNETSAGSDAYRPNGGSAPPSPEQQYRWGSIIVRDTTAGEDTNREFHGASLKLWSGSNSKTYFGAPRHRSKWHARAALLQLMRRGNGGKMPSSPTYEPFGTYAPAQVIREEVRVRPEATTQEWMDRLDALCHLRQWDDPVYDGLITPQGEFGRLRFQGKLLAVPATFSVSGRQRSLADSWRAIAKRLVLEEIGLSADFRAGVDASLCDKECGALPETQ